jgi:hypothetical protein
MPMKARRGGGGIAPNVSQAGTRNRWWVISAELQTLYPMERLGTFYTGR